MFGLLPQETVLTWQSVTSKDAQTVPACSLPPFGPKSFLLLPYTVTQAFGSTVLCCYFRLNEKLRGFVFIVLLRW